MSCKNCNCERISELEKRVEEVADHSMSLAKASEKADLAICEAVELLRRSIRDIGGIVNTMEIGEVENDS